MARGRQGATNENEARSRTMGKSAAEPASERDIGTRSPVAASLVPGIGIVLLVALCTILAWPAGSMVAAQPAAGSTGDVQWIRLFAWAQVVAFGLFAVAVLVIRRWPARTIHVAIIAAAIQLIPLAAPLMLSTDAYSYWNAGRLTVYDSANPYRDVPADYPDDPSFSYIPREWSDTPTVYGPAFTLVSDGVAIVAGDQAPVAAWLFRLTAGASMVALTVLLARMAKAASFAAAFVGWNPIFAIQFAGAGHNDALMITLIVLGLWYLHRRNVRLAAGLWALSLFVKALASILIPLQVLEDRARGRRSLVPSLGLWILVLAGLSTLSFGWLWLGSFLPIFESAAAADLNSLAIWPRVASQLPDLVVKVGPIVGFACAYVVLLRQACQGRARRGLAMGLFLVASPFLWTWYVITPAALAAVEDDVPALAIALGLCAYTGLYLGVSGSVLDVILG
jgi:hypothetical protein